VVALLGSRLDQVALTSLPYAIFDIETRVDKRLVNETHFRGEGLSDDEAFARLRAELVESRGSDFFPLSFHVPVSIAVGTVSGEYLLQSVETIVEHEYGEERLVREFWERVERFRGCLVTFNGRQFDLPVLELQALRYGCVVPHYFGEDSPYRRRYQIGKHLDLYEFLTNFGTYRIRGGFDLLLRAIGLPGKGSIDGSQVQQLWEQGRLAEIHTYCRRDVIQTYFLLLRVELIRGRITPEHYQHVLEQAAEYRRLLDPAG
jgi:predicted PolB exonuclease-like 3'-5' exonuclease